MRFGIIIGLAALLACSQNTIVTPVPGSPCYYQEIECRGGGCCTRGTECGGDWPNCPKDSCCGTGDTNGPLFGLKVTPKRYPGSGK